MNITIGCDPEVFVKNSTGRVISAHNLIPGTKASPYAVDFGAVQVDGMALEFNIEPTSNLWDFSEKVFSVVKTLKTMIPPSYGLVVSPVADFEKEYIDKQPLEARQLGCDPDFNAYTGGMPNEKPNADVNFRTASGHIHIGWTKDVDVTHPDHLEACMMVTKQLDIALGSLESMWCPPNKRKELYGKLGTFRPKSYGVEYRVLSNAWLKSPRLARFVADATLTAVRSLLNGNRWYENVKDDEYSMCNIGYKYMRPTLFTHFKRNDVLDAYDGAILGFRNEAPEQRTYLK